MAVERLKDAASGASDHPKFAPMREKFAAAMADDLNTPIALVALEEALAVKKVDAGVKRAVIEEMDAVLGLGLFDLSRGDLRLRPRDATITEEEIEAELIRRKEARVAKDFTTSDAIRESLGKKGRGDGRRPAGLGLEALTMADAHTLLWQHLEQAPQGLSFVRDHEAEGFTPAILLRGSASRDRGQ